MTIAYSGPGSGREHPCARGCQAAAAQDMMARADRLLRSAEYLKTTRYSRGIADMSQALWCDAGNHSFSSRDTRRQHFERTVLDEDGKEVTEPWDTCGPHADSMFQAAKTDHADPVKIKALEQERGING